ncbi:RNA polymerase II transcriptional coactivator [Melia azedarach]|uniref:RNA polymerase II transcriptional coactivator n=1 Tax=Melia azedarach TaxID=155640 RepID=A0ACC1XWD3_MELAZ|nr:RNA polymerase II transcriptional coactivator [Melia azedarach]
MSWKGKRKEEEEYASDGSDNGHAPPKKASRTDAADDSDDIVVCEISKNRRVSVRNWQGKVWIDIREFYVKDGKQFPGKKGISLSVDQWNVLRNHVEEIDKALGDGDNS